MVNILIEWLKNVCYLAGSAKYLKLTLTNTLNIYYYIIIMLLVSVMKFRLCELK